MDGLESYLFRWPSQGLPEIKSFRMSHEALVYVPDLDLDLWTSVGATYKVGIPNGTGNFALGHILELVWHDRVSSKTGQQFSRSIIWSIAYHIPLDDTHPSLKEERFEELLFGPEYIAKRCKHQQKRPCRHGFIHKNNFTYLRQVRKHQGERELLWHLEFIWQSWFAEAVSEYEFKLEPRKQQVS